MNSKYTLGPIFAFCVVLSSCNHYIDQSKTLQSWPIMQGEMQFYPDSNVLEFKSNMVFRADTEKWPARSFYSQFPKGLIWYDFDYGASFIFYYSDKQVIAIWINIQNLPNKPDSIFVPSGDYVTEFRNAKLVPSGHKYNIREIPYMNNRKQVLIRRRDAMILLYNIKQRNFDNFLKKIETFKFI